MKKWMKLVICMLVILAGCMKQTVIEPEQPIVTQPVAVEKEPTPFDKNNVVTIAVSPITTDLDSALWLYEIQIYNHSNDKIEMNYIELSSDAQINQLTVNRTIIPNSQITVLYQYYREITNISVLGYEYQKTDGENKRILIDLTRETVKYPEQYESENRYYLPLIPNAGLTIFAWKENNEWKFDYLLGHENDEISGYFNQHSLINAFTWSDAKTYHYIRSLDGDMNQKMETYIKEQMKFIIQYHDIVFVMQGEEEHFEELNKKYPFMRTIVVYEKGTKECNRIYCAASGYESSNIYSFSEKQLQSVGKNSYSMEELITELEAYEFLNYHYVKGRYGQLTEEEAIEIDALFLSHDRRLTVENMKYIGADKPVIYLYPEKEISVSVELDYLGTLRTTYPEYNKGWNVIAKSDGTLINKADGKEYSYLFWEGTGPVSYQMDKGFVVKKEDTISFLQEKLAYLGLIPKEYNEFIVYWLPYLQKSEYNLIVFQEDAYTDVAKLNIQPTPDSIQRVFMTFKGLDEPLDIKPQKLTPFKRKGFAVIEWGGVEITD